MQKSASCLLMNLIQLNQQSSQLKLAGTPPNTPLKIMRFPLQRLKKKDQTKAGHHIYQKVVKSIAGKYKTVKHISKHLQIQ